MDKDEKLIIAEWTGSEVVMIRSVMLNMIPEYLDDLRHFEGKKIKTDDDMDIIKTIPWEIEVMKSVVKKSDEMLKFAGIEIIDD